jgi:alkanesulfonate monooxygenase SsuD/methylene tetrahydromethanopterin reductase-like flavin-dependent oxidoreductase (luciferase family)
MRFGIFGFGRTPYRALADRVRLAEALGFASAWVDDDLLTPRYSQFEPWTLLGALARDTSTIRLGTMVTVITFRHPSLLAAQVVTLDHISDGRVEIGLGTGGPPNPYRAFSQTDWTPRERAERLEEYVKVLGPLLQGETVTHAGQHYPIQDAEALPTLQQPRPPLIIAAYRQRELQLAAGHADGWNSLELEVESGGTFHRLSSFTDCDDALGGMINCTLSGTALDGNPVSTMVPPPC